MRFLHFKFHTSTSLSQFKDIRKSQAKIFGMRNYNTREHSILHIGSILRSVFSFTPQPIYPIWNISPLPIVKEANWTPGMTWGRGNGKKKKSAWIESWFPDFQNIVELLQWLSYRIYGIYIYMLDSKMLYVYAIDYRKQRGFVTWRKWLSYSVYIRYTDIF